MAQIRLGGLTAVVRRTRLAQLLGPRREDRHVGISTPRERKRELERKES